MPRHFAEALKIPEIRLFIGSVAFFTLASRALAVVIAFQIYAITQSAMALGLLGLVEAIPALSLVLFGGYVADRFNRRKILLITRAGSVACAAALAALSWNSGAAALAGLYAVIFLAGIARGFADPANTAFEAQVVPKPLTVNAASWISSTWITCSVLGPGAIGFVFEAWGARGAYLLIAAGFLLSWIATVRIRPKIQAPPPCDEPMMRSISVGWKFVFGNQALLGGMALDLFAVLFSGAVALLPIYAQDILRVGARGLGLLNAAPALGALTTMFLATHHPPIARAGRNLLLSVTGFGFSVLVFAFSRNFWLSMAALYAIGVFDGVSVVIRRSMLRLLSPDELRGRIASVSWIFVCASNELGTFQSGMIAALIGAVPCVALGGMMTFVIVGSTALLAPQLRRLRFDVNTLEQRT